MPKIAIINTAEETLDILRQILDDEGFSLEIVRLARRAVEGKQPPPIPAGKKRA